MLVLINYLQSIVHDTHDKQTSQVIFVMSWKVWREGKHSTPSYNTRNSRFLPSFHDVNRSLCAEFNLSVTLYSRFQFLFAVWLFFRSIAI